MYRLVFLSGRYQGKRLVVRQAITLVGRAAECHLLLPDDDQLASRHARFEERGTGVYLSGLASGYCVERNGQPVVETVRLAHNDLLVLGQTQIQFQDIIAPHPRLRPSTGLLQPFTWLVVVAILALEIALLAFLVDWPRHVIRPETEAADLIRAKKIRVRKIRAAQAARNSAQTKTTAQAGVPGSVVTLPGTTSAASVPPPPAALTNAASGPIPPPPAAATNPVLQVLDEANFAPADTNLVTVALPPVSAADPSIEEAQRLLAEAVSAAQFADYAKAIRILNQIHQMTPGFLPAHAEHARLLEARGNLDDAHQRWTQILGIVPEGSPFRTQALAERERLAHLQTLQTRILQSPGTPDLSALPRHIRIVSPAQHKMPADANIDEMRVLNATVELASEAPLFKNASIQVFITFYDIDSGDQIKPTRAITTSSPVVLGNALAERRIFPLEATYVVPRGLRTREAQETGLESSYYGFTLHVFAGQILQDAYARPKKLLDRPIYFPIGAGPEP